MSKCKRIEEKYEGAKAVDAEKADKGSSIGPRGVRKIQGEGSE